MQCALVGLREVPGHQQRETQLKKGRRKGMAAKRNLLQEVQVLITELTADLSVREYVEILEELESDVQMTLEAARDDLRRTEGEE